MRIEGTTVESALIDMSHLPGLPCRVPGGCRGEFIARLRRSDSADVLSAAAKDRDRHERGAHGYHHPPPLVVRWHYGGRAGQKAR